MRYLLCAVLALVPLLGQAQQASPEETEALGKIAQRLAAGLPPDWAQAEMTVDLQKANAEEGAARYLVRRRKSAAGQESN